jgi:hypothetical protein
MSIRAKIVLAAAVVAAITGLIRPSDAATERVAGTPTKT